jgi:hypothetical protein
VVFFIPGLVHGRNQCRGRDHRYKDQGDEKVMHCKALSDSMRQPGLQYGALSNTRQALVEFFSNVTLTDLEEEV